MAVIPTFDIVAVGIFSFGIFVILNYVFWFFTRKYKVCKEKINIWDIFNNSDLLESFDKV